MRKPDRLRVLLDSSSIDNLPVLDRRSKALLKYRNSKFLDFIRSPENAEYKDLQQIVAFIKKYNPDGSLHSIEIIKGKSKAQYAFSYRKQDIEEIGK